MIDEGRNRDGEARGRSPIVTISSSSGLAFTHRADLTAAIDNAREGHAPTELRDMRAVRGGNHANDHVSSRLAAVIREMRQTR